MIMKLFRQPQHVGEFPIIDGSTFTVQAGNPGQTDVIRLSVKIDADKIADAKFKAQGGVTTIAAAEYVADTIIGVKSTDLANINSQTINDALQLPPERINAALLADDALQQIIQAVTDAS